MLLPKRFRIVVIAVTFYALSGAAVGYFAWHAQNGGRGLTAKKAYKIRVADLQQELLVLRMERADWQRRIDLLRAEQLDRDLLEERARVLLNAAHRNDVIVILDRER